MPKNKVQMNFFLGGLPRVFCTYFLRLRLTKTIILFSFFFSTANLNRLTKVACQLFHICQARQVQCNSDILENIFVKTLLFRKRVTSTYLIPRNSLRLIRKMFSNLVKKLSLRAQFTAYIVFIRSKVIYSFLK